MTRMWVLASQLLTGSVLKLNVFCFFVLVVSHLVLNDKYKEKPLDKFFPYFMYSTSLIG